MRSSLVLGVIALLAAGCSQTPSLSGGKPLEHWVKAMADPDAKLRKTAVAKLGNAGAPDPQAWAALAGARDNASSIRSTSRAPALLPLKRFSTSRALSICPVS